MKYEIDLSSLPHVHKRDPWDLFKWSDVFITIWQSIIGIPIFFVVLRILFGEWALSWDGYFSLLVAAAVLAAIINFGHASKMADKLYNQKRESQKQSAEQKSKDLNDSIRWSEDICNECLSTRNLIVSEMENAKSKYNRNLFGQYWDSIESIAKLFGNYRDQI